MATIGEWAWKRLVPGWMKPGNGGRTAWVCFYAVSNVIADGALRSAMQGMIRMQCCGASALRLIGKERQLEWYAGESVEDYRMRVWRAWDTWDFAGSQSLIDILVAAGYYPYTTTGNTFLIRPHFTSPVVADYYSEFNIQILVDSTSPKAAITRPLMCSDSLICSDDVACGTMASIQDCYVVFNIIRKFRPAKDVCRYIEFIEDPERVNSVRLEPYWCPRWSAP